MLLAILFVSTLVIALAISQPIESALTMQLGLTSCLVALVGAFCECGFSLNMLAGTIDAAVPTMSIGPTNSTGLNSPIANFLDNSYVFTDLIETDAFHIKNIHDDTDWSIQNYNVSASSARGPYG